MNDPSEANELAPRGGGEETTIILSQTSRVRPGAAANAFARFTHARATGGSDAVEVRTSVSALCLPRARAGDVVVVVVVGARALSFSTGAAVVPVAASGGGEVRLIRGGSVAYALHELRDGTPSIADDVRE